LIFQFNPSENRAKASLVHACYEPHAGAIEKAKAMDARPERY
jgi:hypothetical protein